MMQDESSAEVGFGAGASAEATPDPGVPEAPGILAVLEAGLAMSIDGLSILDREMSFEGSGRIDFGGVDGEGRLVLVLLLDDDVDIASLEAFDLAALSRRHGDLIARHLGVFDETSDAAGLAPRCILVGESFGPRLRERLALLGELFELFELQALSSERGRYTYLVPVGAAEGGVAAPGPKLKEISPEAFLASLDAPSRAAAGILISRMQRMDSEFDVIFTEAGGRWTYGGRDFLGVELRGERVIGRVLPGGRPTALATESAVEAIVEEAFSAYVRLLGLFDEDEQAIELQPAIPEPLLSAEEIAAFQS